MPELRVTFQEYARQRKRLNTRLGILILLIIPLPVILYWQHATSIVILLVSLVPPLFVGVLYPTWWRRGHHPNRALKIERRFTAVSLICRPLAFDCGIATLAAWSLDGPGASHAGIVAALATAVMVTVPFFFAPKNDGGSR